MRTRSNRLLVVVASSSLTLTALAGCGGGESTGTPSTPSTVADAAQSPTTASTPSTTAPQPATTDADLVESSDSEYPMVRGSRYCELLFLAATSAGIQATVFGTQGLSYCPDEAWRAIDTAALATETGSLFVLPNGPRIWLVDRVEKADLDTSERQTFGGLEMNRLATVSITDPSSMGTPYTWQEVDRRTVFTFAAGSTEYFLVDPDGHRYVMQALSQQIDPAIDEQSLATLGERLALPSGWTYSSEVLSEDLVIETMDTPARVLQDEFRNSYSWVPGT